jgi:hypothetical protein
MPIRICLYPPQKNAVVTRRDMSGRAYYKTFKRPIYMTYYSYYKAASG